MPSDPMTSAADSLAGWPPVKGRKQGERLPEGSSMFTSWRPLTSADVTIAQEVFANQTTLADLGADIPTIQNIRQSHHKMAQLVASGMRDFQVALICGYSPARVANLRQSPAFMELVAHYSGEVTAEWKDFIEDASELSQDLIQKLREDLEAHPEKFTPTVVLEAIKVLADRSGHAPVSRSVNVNINTDMATRLQAARRRMAAAQDITPPLLASA